MKTLLKLLPVVLFSLLRPCQMKAVVVVSTGQTDSLRLQPRRPWLAAAETFLLNAGVWAFDRYAMNEDFARISGKSISHNFHHGFVWDNDQFSTNLFAHPYHGSLYFNAARCNGMTFWQSVPYSFGGSLMWEVVCEVEPPAINDLIATTVGGVALGEVTHRMSALVIDDTRRGAARVWREALGTLICPVRGLNRLINGEMWRVLPRRPDAPADSLPLAFSVKAGARYLADDSHLFRGDYNPYVELSLSYGDVYRGSRVPYDNFSFDIGIGLSANQPLINRISLIGNLWSTAVDNGSDMEMVFGLYQFFNYYDSEEVIPGSGRIPYKISEAASVGPGILYRFPQVGQLHNLEQRIYLSGILLGGSLTDHYHVIDRNYNMGSGFSLKSRTLLDFGRWGSFSLDLQHFRIYTWKGYDAAQLETANPLYLNAQGDEGDVSFTIINPAFSIVLRPRLSLNIETTYFLRDTHYCHHEDVRFNTFETKLGLRWQL